MDYVKTNLLLNIMSDLAFFQQVPHDLRKALSKNVELRLCKMDEYVYHRGDISDGLYVILQGSIAVIDPSQPKPHNYITTIMAGDCFGSSGLLTPEVKRYEHTYYIDIYYVVLILVY